MKVLISEDDRVSRRLLETFLLKWGYDVLTTIDGSRAMEVLKRPQAPSLVISDWMMPGMDGLDLCRSVRDLENRDYVYFILLTSKGGKRDVIKGLEAGADDYLVKPFHQEELRWRVKIGERILELERRVKALASTDSLTGLLNRRAFMERMELEMHRSLRERTAFSLLLADIDHFKKVNDCFGHQAGDLALQEFAKQLNKHTRSYDYIGRYGGEEFILCLPGAEIHEAASVAERMRKEAAQIRILPPGRKEVLQFTACFGVSSFRFDQNDTLDALISRADEAMYRAKRNGRNCVITEFEERQKWAMF